MPSTTLISKFKQFVVDSTNLKHFEDDSTQKYGVIFEAIFRLRGWEEKFCLSKPRTTERPRAREGILYPIFGK